MSENTSRETGMMDWRAIIKLLRCVVTVGAVLCNGADASEPGKFPGQGKVEDFVKAGALNNKGVALETRGKASESLEFFEKAISVYPYSSIYYDNYGSALADIQRYAEARRAFNKAIKLDPKDCQIYCDLADALTKEKKYREAETACNQALRINPDHAMSLVNLAEICLATNRVSQANKLLTRAYYTADQNLKRQIALDLDKSSRMSGTNSGGYGH